MRLVDIYLMEVKKLLEENPNTFSIQELSDRFDISEMTLKKFIEKNNLRVIEYFDYNNKKHPLL